VQEDGVDRSAQVEGHLTSMHSAKCAGTFEYARPVTRNTHHKESNEMRRIQSLKPKAALLAVGLLGIACSSAPSKDTAPPQASLSPEISCAAKSKRTQAPRNSIAELVWCVAATDNLWDPDHLFGKTLDIKSFSTSAGITWGIQAAAGGSGHPDRVQHLPDGIEVILYQRMDPKGLTQPGHINVDFSIDPAKSCVTLRALAETFGSEYWLMAEPVVAPAPALPGAPQPFRRESQIYGIFFKSPRLFMGDPSGQVNFRFQHTNCVRSVTVHRSLSLSAYRRFQEQSK
jgi:hypothetical protein